MTSDPAKDWRWLVVRWRADDRGYRVLAAMPNRRLAARTALAMPGSIVLFRSMPSGRHEMEKAHAVRREFIKIASETSGKPEHSPENLTY